MTAPLKVITQAESWKQEVCADVVEQARDLLAMAETGEIQGVAYAALSADGSMITCFTKSANQGAIIGGLALVQHKMLSRL